MLHARASAGRPAVHRLTLRSLRYAPRNRDLWPHLKGKQLEGRKIRRASSLYGYPVDFWCPAYSTAIVTSTNPARDADLRANRVTIVDVTDLPVDIAIARIAHALYC